MSNITLISTIHQEQGKCTSQELFHILEHIRPDVIFEELPPSYFKKYYNEYTRSNLESDAINMYRKKFKVHQELVDSEDVPPEEFFKKYRQLEKRIRGLSGRHGFDFRNLKTREEDAIYTYGFEYLNKGNYVEMYSAIESEIEIGLAEINDAELTNFYKEWKKIIAYRENHMLTKIYDYSQSHDFKNAVFTLGAAHRGAIISKIPKFQEEAKKKLNWIL